MTSTQGSDSATGLNAVVGVDGSENSRAALNWALHHVAGHGGGSVRAVMSWTYAPVAAAGYGFGGSLPPAESMEEATKGALDALLETVTAPEGVEVVPVVREGAPSHVVLDEGEGADLIVLGTNWADPPTEWVGGSAQFVRWVGIGPNCRRSGSEDRPSSGGAW